MAETQTLFVTKIYRAALEDAPALNKALRVSCHDLAAQDRAGQAWSKEKAYKGYTSYASLNDLPKRDPNFADLKKQLDKAAQAFAKELHFAMAGRKLVLDSLWVNVLEPGGVHTGHIHPHSVLSGTYYVEIPAGASALKFEDPRLPLMMAAPPRTEDAPEAERTFIYLEPKAGDVILWESFLRHEVTPNAAKTARISVSFNYRMA
jgi:uncharacterized protein (TIGR02466 family)